jgi:hypothetical protein
MDVNIKSRYGVKLLTGGKYCEEDINITLDDSLIGGKEKLTQIFDKSVVRIESQDLTGATEIYPRFLQDCISLESIEFVDTITIIGADAVRNCPALKEIILPNSVTTLGANAFRGATSVTNLKLSSKCPIIPTYCFANLDSLTTLTIPKGVTSIEASAFYNCDVLEEIHWASSIASVYQDAFDFCKKVKRLYLTNLEAYFKVGFEDLNAQPVAASPQDGNTQIYLNDELITHLITPSGTSAIPKYSIYNWGSVVEFTGTSGLTSIGRYSMSSMKNLKTLNLPKSLTSFDSTALNASTNIEVVNLEDGFNCAMNLSATTKLTADSMVSMFNALATITTTKTLQLGTTNLNKLTAEQKAIATNKGWTLA